jgi:UDP-glucose 4-epimerase
MAVLLTGAPGFIGKHTACFLSEKKIAFTGLSKTPRKGFEKADLKKPLEIKGAFSGVIHLAVRKALEKNETDLEYFKDNVLGTINVLEFSRKNDIPKIVFASSISVYGKKLSGKITEKTKTNPESAYAESKKIAEEAVIDYSDRYGIKYSVLRYSTVFGPGQSEKTELSQIAEKCRAGKKIFFPKDSKRNFIFVEDVARANFFALRSKKNSVLNIAGKENVSWGEAAVAIKKILKSKSEIETGKKPAGKFMIDISLAKKTIGFYPKFSFYGGLEKTFVD